MRYLARTILIASTGLPWTCAAQLPTTLQPPATQHAILTVQGRGSQIYSCHPTNGRYQWTFQAPVARLFDTSGNEVGTHGDGPVWTYDDSSAIAGTMLATAPSPDPASIPWLLLKAVKPQRTGILTSVEFITRSDTHGGLAPQTGCDAPHEGTLVHVPYTATYTFYASQPAH